MASSAAAALDAKTRGSDLDEVCIRIFEADFDYVYRSLLRMGVGASDAEDLAQEVFLVMWRRRSDWDAGRPLRPWLFGVALRIAHDHRQRRRRESPLGFLDRTDERPHGEDHLASARAQRLVLQAITALPEKQRAVLILHEIDGTPMREVAGALGVPLFTAYTRLRAARKSFAKAVRRLQMARPGSLDLEPDPLLTQERDRVPPPGLRERAVERYRSVLPALPAPLPAPVPVPWAVKAAAVAAGGALTVMGAVALSGPRPSISAPLSVTASRTSPAGGPMTPGVSPGGALTQGLVGYWRFDQGAGSRLVEDASPGGNDCVFRRLDSHRATIEGVAGRAIHFDGKGLLECGQPATIERLQHGLTVAGWLNLDHREHDLRAILAWQRGYGHERFGLFFGLAGSKLVLASDVWGRIEAPLGSVVGRWVHVAASRGEDGRKHLFIDGLQVAEDGGPLLPLGTGNNPLTVGGHIHTGEPHKITQQIHAGLDELALYDHALSAREVATLATSTAPSLIARALAD